MPTPLKIDFVSDISCPWCAIGLKSLEAALERIGEGVTAEIRFRAFELNPRMSKAGEDSTEHLVQKYRTTPEQIDRNREVLRERGDELGFTFRLDRRSRVYNTFDAHRLLHWAWSEGRQHELKHALLKAYFTEGRDIGDHDTLAEIAASVGLDRARAMAVLASQAHAEDVRAEEAHYTSHGIHAVPSVIVDEQHLIQGGQPVEVFERALRQIAGEKLAAAERSRSSAP